MKLNRFNNIVVFNSYTISIKMSFYFVFDTETNGLPTRNKRDSTGKGDNFNNVYLYHVQILHLSPYIHLKLRSDYQSISYR